LTELGVKTTGMTPTPTILLRQRNTKKSLDFSGDQRTMDLVVRETGEKSV